MISIIFCCSSLESSLWSVWYFGWTRSLYRCCWQVKTYTSTFFSVICDFYVQILILFAWSGGISMQWINFQNIWRNASLLWSTPLMKRLMKFLRNEVTMSFHILERWYFLNHKLLVFLRSNAIKISMRSSYVLHSWVYVF